MKKHTDLFLIVAIGGVIALFFYLLKKKNAVNVGTDGTLVSVDGNGVETYLVDGQYLKYQTYTWMPGM